jgi:hypothetical protein
MRSWVPWSDVIGGPHGTIEEFRDILRKYPRSSLLRACARLSVLFNYGPDAGTTANQEQLDFFVRHRHWPEQSCGPDCKAAEVESKSSDLPAD